MAGVAIFAGVAIWLVQDQATAQTPDELTAQPDPDSPALMPRRDGRMLPAPSARHKVIDAGPPALMAGPDGRLLPASTTPPAPDSAVPALMPGPGGRMLPAPSARHTLIDAGPPPLMAGPDGRMLPKPSIAPLEQRNEVFRPRR